MSRNTIYAIIAASSVAIILLGIFQRSWYQQSSNLIQQQIYQKTNMALCQSISQYESAAGVNRSWIVDSFRQDQLFDSILMENLKQYRIDHPFTLSISNSESTCSKGATCIKSCGAEALEEKWIEVLYDQPDVHVKAGLGFHNYSSFLILAFILLVFLWANQTLLRQQNLHEKQIHFFNHLAHELRTPVTSLGLAISLIQPDSPSDKSDLFQLLSKENRKLKWQVDKMITHLSNPDIISKMHYSEIQLTDLLHKAIEDFELLATEKNMQLQLITASTPSVSADSYHLGHAIKNLLDNAIKYGNPASLIQIQQDIIDAEACIKIRNEGTPIPKEDLERIFQPNYRSAFGKDTSFGLGFGLAYSLKVIQAHQGTISALSGSNWNEFTITLPIVR